MNTEIFRKKVEKELKTLNEEQVVQFAWLCGVRVLPFLGCNRDFSYWKETDRQKYLYAIFNALDIIADIFINKRNDSYNTNAGIEANTYRIQYQNYTHSAFTKEVAETISRGVNAAEAAGYMSSRKAKESTNNDDVYEEKELNTEAHRISSAYLSIRSISYALTTSVNTTHDSAAETAIFAVMAGALNNVDLESVILNDINAKGKQELYIDVWDNFQYALKNVGCEYWGRLYQQIFKNGFKLNSEALKIRLNNVPKEIREQGAAAVANYLVQLEKGVEQLNEARIIILGEKGAGKTCLARRLENPNAPMTTESESTAGVDTTIWRKDGINIRIWDFAGHTVTHAVHQFFLSERCLYIIVYDGRTEERNRLDYWLNHMKNYGGDSKAIILVNRRDKHQVDIPINRLKEQYPIEGLYTFSIQDDGEELERFRDVVLDYIKNNPLWNEQKIPENYYSVKKELEELFIRGNRDKCLEYIKKKEFDTIAERNGIEKKENLLNDLHALGISLWYKEMEEFDTMVLNPEWISNGVYKIVNWVNNEKKHSLTIEEFATVFKDDNNRYPVDKYDFFFKLMEHYELAYKTSSGKCLIIPHLLKEDRPETLPDFPVGESLLLRYKAEQLLPPNTISRFIVQHNQDIKKVGGKYIVWRYGVVLEDGKGSTALVREEDRTISVSVTGRTKTEYLSTLRETLNDIFNSYKSDKPELQYRVERFGQIPDEIEKRNPLWLPDTKILNHLRSNIPYYDDTVGSYIDLRNVTINNNITAQTMLSGQNIQYAGTVIQNIQNFYDCSINLQGSLNDLARIVERKGDKNSAEELKDAANTLEQTEKCKTSEEVKKKGMVNGLKRIVEALGDEKSKLYRTIKGIDKGIEIAQNIAEKYNDIAQWLGFPTVPKPFLKKEAEGRKRFKLFG